MSINMIDIRSGRWEILRAGSSQLRKTEESNKVGADFGLAEFQAIKPSEVVSVGSTWHQHQPLWGSKQSEYLWESCQRKCVSVTIRLLWAGTFSEVFGPSPASGHSSVLLKRRSEIFRKHWTSTFMSYRYRLSFFGVKIKFWFGHIILHNTDFPSTVWKGSH